MASAEKTLRLMAVYIRRHGFSPRYREAKSPRCGCFLFAHDQVSSLIAPNRHRIALALMEVIGDGLFAFVETRLRANGWHGRAAAKDAAAACDLAADLCAPSPR